MSTRNAKLARLWAAVLMAGALAACEGGGGRLGKHGRGLYVRAAWQKARGVIGHRVHVVEHTLACSECHDLGGEEVDTPTASACTARCHERESKIDHARSPEGVTDCLSCHAFTVEEAGTVAPDAWSCMRCHAEPQRETPAVEIHARSTCDSCHRPHEDPAVLPSACRDCHDDVDTTHAATGKEPAQVCTTCHQHQHGRAREAALGCQPCHAESEPVIPASALFEGHGECTGCHRPHAYGATEAVACRSCHETVPVLGGGRIAAHATCTSCHAPHAVHGGVAEACAGCHRAQETDHPRAAAGTVCATCHDVHPTGDEGALRACSHCHHEAAGDRDFHGRTACTGCHSSHRFALDAGDRGLCSRCHGGEVTAASSLAGHARCESCHQGLPHRPTTTTPCAGCHGSVLVAAIEPHRSCASCHEPHAGRVLKSCGSCHAQQARQAPAGHADCGSCHEGHSGAVVKTCASCHGGKTREPHGSLAEGCASCHSAHGPSGATHAPACTSCHAVARLPALHQEPKHQECARCHAAHRTAVGPERPTCLSCHADRRDHFPDAPRCSSCHLFE
jgi:hypothetical protein